MTPVGPGIVAVRVSLVLVIALVLEVSIAPMFRLFGVQGDLMLLIAIVAGLAAGPDRGAAIGFASGLAYDLMLQTPFGLSALTYALVAFTVGSLQDSVLRAAWWIPVAPGRGKRRGCHPVRRVRDDGGCHVRRHQHPEGGDHRRAAEGRRGDADHPGRAVGHGHAAQRARVTAVYR